MTFKVFFKSTVLPPLNGSLVGVVHNVRGVPRPDVAINIIDPSDYRVVARTQSDAYSKRRVFMSEVKELTTEWEAP